MVSTNIQQTNMLSTNNHFLPNHIPSLQHHPHHLPPPSFNRTHHCSMPLHKPVSAWPHMAKIMMTWEVSAMLLTATWQPTQMNDKDNKWLTRTTNGKRWVSYGDPPPLHYHHHQPPPPPTVFDDRQPPLRTPAMSPHPMTLPTTKPTAIIHHCS